MVKALAFVLAILLVPRSLLANPEYGPMPPGTKCLLATTPPQEVEYDVTIFPCTRDDINRCNACERKVQRLEKIILTTPPMRFDWTTTAKVAAIAGGIGIVLGVVGGVWLGSKL